MPETSSLLIDLTGVARLADVQRPVASVWRTRFASATDPFPPVVSEHSGRALFDAMSVAHWLTRTEHGNNPDAIADAAAAATPAGFDIADASHVATVDALLALRVATGAPVGGVDLDELHQRARATDPDDACLVTEVSTAPASWAEWTDLLADAAYSPLGASQILERRHSTTRSSEGSSGPLSPDAEALLLNVVGALTSSDTSQLIVTAGFSTALVAALHGSSSDDVELTLSPSPDGRAARRRLICDGVFLSQSHSPTPVARLSLARLSSRSETISSAMLRVLDDLAQGMRDDDRAVVVGPANVLIDAVGPSDSLARTDVLRSGRVRAIVRLPAGLITSAPREALALWVLGRETGDVAISERFTAVADLTEATLTEATRADLTSDVLAAMGNVRSVRAHAFRFTRLGRTTSLLAARGALRAGKTKPTTTDLPTHDLPALLDQALTELGECAPSAAPTSQPGATLPDAYLESLIAARHVRILPGTRVAPDENSVTGLIVVRAADLDDPARIGDHRVDPLMFAAQHPSARLTVAGDVIFCTSPTPRAWVDREGSKVVAHPARVLRIDPADPAGLIPELVAADIERARGGAGAWRRWMLRRVAPASIAPLRAALAEVAARRAELVSQVNALDRYSNLLTAGVVAGVVTLPDPADPAATPASTKK